MILYGANEEKKFSQHIWQCGLESYCKNNGQILMFLEERGFLWQMSNTLLSSFEIKYHYKLKKENSHNFRQEDSHNSVEFSIDSLFPNLFAISDKIIDSEVKLWVLVKDIVTPVVNLYFDYLKEISTKDNILQRLEIEKKILECYSQNMTLGNSSSFDYTRKQVDLLDLEAQLHQCEFKILTLATKLKSYNINTDIIKITQFSPENKWNFLRPNVKVSKYASYLTNPENLQTLRSYDVPYKILDISFGYEFYWKKKKQTSPSLLPGSPSRPQQEGQSGGGPSRPQQEDHSGRFIVAKFSFINAFEKFMREKYIDKIANFLFKQEKSHQEQLRSQNNSLSRKIEEQKENLVKQEALLAHMQNLYRNDQVDITQVMQIKSQNLMQANEINCLCIEQNKLIAQINEENITLAILNAIVNKNNII